MPKKYPLEGPLAWKEQGIDVASSEIGKRTRELNERMLESARARQALDEEMQRQADVRASEQGALLGGTRTAADLAQQSAWEVGAQLESARVENRVASAHASVALAQAEEDLARHALSEAQLEFERLETHRAKWISRENVKEEKKAEDEAHEAWRPRR